MCQSKADGGKRCNAHRGFYFSANTLDSEMKDDNNKIQVPKNPAQALHIMAYAANGYDISDKHITQAQNFDISELTPEQQWVTWKNFSLSLTPSKGLTFLYESGFEPYYEELHAVRGVPQPANWHPEGSVEKHLQEAADKAAGYARDDKLNQRETQIAVLGATVHDFGKATHTQIVGDKITSHQHDTAGAPIAKAFLQRIGAPEPVTRIVPTLVKLHMCHAHKNLSYKGMNNIFNRLERKGATFDQLIRVMNADVGGRGTASEPRTDDYWKAQIKKFAEQEERDKKAKEVKNNLPFTADSLRAQGYNNQQVGQIFIKGKSMLKETPNLTQEDIIRAYEKENK